MFLCCHVVKLGKAKKQNPKKKSTPKKVEVLPGIFYKTSYGCMCQSYCFFLGCFLVFACWSKNTIKIGFFDDFEMLIFSFFGQKSRVNNLATVGSITWPHLWPNFCPERWPSYWPYFFHPFFVKTCFFSKISFSLQKEEDFWTTKKTKKKVDKLLTYGGQVIDPTAYIYIYIYSCGVIIWAKFGLLRCYYLGQVCFLQNTVCQKTL